MKFVKRQKLQENSKKKLKVCYYYLKKCIKVKFGKNLATFQDRAFSDSLNDNACLDITFHA